jgi:hypothetical protein
MNKYISIILAGTLLILALVVLLIVLKNILTRKNKLNKKNLLIILSLIASMSYFISSVDRFILLFKIEKFGNEIFSLVSGYQGVKGKYPTNSQQLTEHETYELIKKWKMGTTDHRFGFIGTVDMEEKKLDFIFYAYGFDNDDDEFKINYPLNYMYIFWPFVDGDILVKKSWIKEIDPFKNSP